MGSIGTGEGVFGSSGVGATVTEDEISGLTTGAVQFGDTDGTLEEDATNFFWDETTNANYLRIGSGTSPGEIRLLEGSGGGTNYGSLTVPSALGGNRTYTFPDADTSIPVASQTITLSGPTAARTYTLPDSDQTLAALGLGGQIFSAQTYFTTGNDPIDAAVVTGSGFASAPIIGIYRNFASGSTNTAVARISQTHASDDQAALELAQAADNIPALTLTGVGASMAFAEINSAPTAIASTGQIYTKSDNILYFQDGAGTEQSVITGSTADVSAASWVLDEDTMSSDSATKVPTQQSVKAYVDTQVAGAGGGAFATAANVTSNSPGTLGTDDFVFGSDTTEDDADSTHDNRFFFDKSLGAFRAGSASGTEFDATNRALYSMGLGKNIVVKGAGSLCFGSDSSCESTGDYALAGGLLVSTTALSGSALGGSFRNDQNYSLAVGHGSGITDTTGVAVRLEADADEDSDDHAAIYIRSDAAAPTTTTDKLYNTSNVLTWAGNAVITAGTTATRTIVLTAAGGTPTTTAGCAAATQVETSSNNVNYWALDFDTTTEENCQWQVEMPGNYDGGTVTATFYWTNASGLTTETVDWGIKAVALRDDSPLDTAFGTEITTTDTWIAQGDLHISPTSSAVTIAGTPVAGDMVVFNVARKTATDNLTGDARLLKVVIEYGINAYSH